ncbi:MAG: hypothetical protein ACXADX_00595 [Candidatus Hodarchaeales archaeon]|jgi:glyceraldehyde-3-phosphate dehydrogenase (NAD(P))
MSEMNGNHALVIGTGTIGEPLTSLLCSASSDVGVDKVIFYKHSPIIQDRAMVQALMSKGGELCVAKEKVRQFREIDLEPSHTLEEALDFVSVVVDCTPGGNGLKNKKRYYEPRKGRIKGFLAQGSEFGFGIPYAAGLNDSVLVKDNPEFIQVVSCNTHNIASCIKNIGVDENGKNRLIEGRFLCMRRATDIGQKGGFIPAPDVSKHKDTIFGTHHARDVYHLFRTIGKTLNVFSSAIKLPTQYVHSLFFDLKLDERVTFDDVYNRLEADPLVALTHKTMASHVFSFGRDHGFYGRILNQAIMVLPSLHVKEDEVYPGGGNEVLGFCYTPQDGNSLLSSLMALSFILQGGEFSDRIDYFQKYLFKEV